MEKLYSVRKSKTGTCGSDHELLIAKFWLKLKKAGKTTRPFSSVQSLSCVRLFVTPWTAAHQASLSITNSWSLLKLMCIESVIPYNRRILCHPLLPHSIFPNISIFSIVSVLHISWPKYWNFSFSISPSKEYLGLISFRMDWLDLCGVQGKLKSLQHHSSILWCSAFSIFQLSHTYYWKNHSFD